MNELIPTIEIGKKYLWRAGVVEYCCPSCGYVFGSKSIKVVEQVLVVEAMEDSVGCTCFCGFRIGCDMPGFYHCITPWGNKAIPYTQLLEIEEEDYDY